MTKGRPTTTALLALGLAIAPLCASAQLFGGSPTAQTTETEKGVLASLISRALSTPATRVSIGAVEGALSSDAVVRDIEISDRDGVWLRLDRARLVWRRLALIQRRLEIDRLEIGNLDIRRRPIPAEGQVAGENEPLLPELPVKVEIKAFTLAELKIGQPILGTEARLSATGNARLGNDPSEGLDLTFEAKRLDQPGTLTAKLGLIPQGQRLTLALNVDEPAGGIAARLANIPGLPPVRLEVNGQGTLDAFAARLAFDAGDGIGATGTANLERQGNARQLALDLQARIAGLLPAVAAPVFAGTTRLTGNAVLADDGTITIPGINLVATAARLDIGGTLSRDRVADVTITAANLPTSEGRTVASGADIRRLAFQGRVTGPVTGPSIDATLSAEDAKLPTLRLSRLEAAFRASPAGTATGGATQLDVSGEARASGLVMADPGLARAVGDRVTLALKGNATTEGVADVQTLTVTTPTFAGRYAGRLGSDELSGRLSAEVASLRPFGSLAGLTLAGSASIGADLEGTPRANRFNLKLDGRLSDLATGIRPVDAVAGGRVGLAGTVRVDPTGGYGLDNLTLTAAHATARVNGRIDQDTGDLTLAADLDDLSRVEPRLTGTGALNGRITGGLPHPNIRADLTLAKASALGRPIPRLALTVDVKDALAALNGSVTLDGIVDGKPARGGLQVARPAAGGYRLDALDLAVGSVRAQGGIALDPANLLSGRLSVKALNLDDLSPLLLTKATGAVDADIALSVVGGGQNAQIKGEARRVAVYGFTVAKADADLTVTDLFRRPSGSGQLRIDEAVVGGERISRVRLTLQPPPGGPAGGASAVTLTASARGFDIDAQARVVPGERTRIEVSQLGAVRAGQRIALAGPATLTVAGGAVELRGVAMGFGAGRLTLDGMVGSRLDLTADAKAVPLSAADLFAPGLGLAGTLEGTARIGGTPSAPTGEYRARIDGLASPQTRSLNLPRIDATASGALAGGRATLDANVAAGRIGTVRVSGSLPAGGEGVLDLAVRGSVDAGAATTGLLAAGGRRFAGRVEVDARIGGTLAAPEASGAATLAGGTFSDATQGIQLSNIRARLVARGQDLSVEGASASTRNGGTITATGRVRLDPAAGFPGDVRIQGQNAELVRNSLVTAIANLGLTLSGPLARDPRVSGRVDIVSADVRVPENLPGSLKPLSGTRHVHPTPTTRARLALEAQARDKRGRAAPPFDAVLDLTLNAPGQIVVRGRGLNAELGGALRLTGTLAKPVPNGAFELRRGTFQVLTSKLDFTRGRLSFAGDMTPELDFAATTNAGGAAIQIAVTGPANNPAFAFTSNPDLPQDEVLSRLLFNSPSGQLSAFQALALAQAAAQFSGGGDGAFEGLRRSLGLSGLDVGAGAGGGIGGAAQRAFGNRLSVGIKAGSSAAQTGIGIDYRLTDELRLQGEVGATGGTSVGIGAQYEW